MKSFSFRLVIVALLLVTSGCYRISYRLSGDSGRTYPVSDWNQFFLFGLIPVNETFESGRFCGADQLLEVRSSMRPANVLTGLLSGWLTGATTVEAVCLVNMASTMPDAEISDRTITDPSERKRGGKIPRAELEPFGS